MAEEVVKRTESLVTFKQRKLNFEGTSAVVPD
jgi:hypothetical protein